MTTAPTHDAAGDLVPARLDRFPLSTDPRGRRRRRALVIVAGLALTIAAGVVIWQAEQRRTDTQVLTLRDALVHDFTLSFGRHGPDRGGFLGSRTNGKWGKAVVPRTTEEVLQELRSGVYSASIDEPFCVSPDERHAGDRIHLEADIPPHHWACDLTRYGRPFGWVDIGRTTWNDDGTPSTTVEYGIGPDAGYRWLEERSATP